MWLISIFLLFVIFLLFWMLNRSLYRKTYGDVLYGRLCMQTINCYNTLNNSPFVLYPNFSNYTWSMARKFIFLSIAILLNQFAGIKWLFYIYLAISALSYFTFFERKDSFNRMNKDEKPIFADLYKASKYLIYLNTTYYFVYILFIMIK